MFLFFSLFVPVVVPLFTVLTNNGTVVIFRNMNKFVLCASLCIVLSLAACGDDSNSVEPSSDESSSSIAESSSSSVNHGEAENILKDSRDGQTYRIVTIGSQTWMAENLNYAYTGVPFDGKGFFSDSSSWCYGKEASSCTLYGRLYAWAEAMTLCPEGWHLPDTTEWNTLFTAVGGQSTAGKMLKSTSGWHDSGNGTDDYSFSVLPAGYRYNYGMFNNEGNAAYFWSSSEYDSDNAYYIALNYGNDKAFMNVYDKYSAHSVRCVKD